MNLLPGRIFLAAFFTIAMLAPAIRAQAAEAHPAQAHVQAEEHGQAVLLRRLGECYAVAPAHVVGESLFATLTGASGGAPLGDGDVLQTFGYDLSILHVTGELAQKCGGPIGSLSALDDLLSSGTVAAISSVNPDGSLSRRSVTITDVGLLYLRIRPRGPSDQLFKGLSGSPLMMGNRTVGLLMSVDAETGEGRALRFDRATETLRPFFGISATKAMPSTSRRMAERGSTFQLRVVSWSVPAYDAESRAINLANLEQVWLARPNEFPIELVFELPGSGARTLSSVRLVGDGVRPSSRRIRDFEVLVSSSPNGSWISAASGTYFMNGDEKPVQFAPLRARRIMLRIYSHWGDPDAVGLNSLEALASP